MTNYDLHQLDLNMQKLFKDYPAFAFLNQEKIKNFYQRNAMTLKIMEERKASFIKQYCVHGEDGKPVLTKKEDIDHYTFATPEDEKEYSDKLTEFYTRSIYVES